jgi:hypothetical protein
LQNIQKNRVAIHGKIFSKNTTNFENPKYFPTFFPEKGHITKKAFNSISNIFFTLPKGKARQIR